jgi:hypothetical protein
VKSCLLLEKVGFFLNALLLDMKFLVQVNNVLGCSTNLGPVAFHPTQDKMVELQRAGMSWGLDKSGYFLSFCYFPMNLQI